MKIRIIGTSEECAAAREYYSGLEKQENVQSVSISRLYFCRDSRSQYRLYVEVNYYVEAGRGSTKRDEAGEGVMMKARNGKASLILKKMP